MRIVLADREADLMSILWENGPSTVAQVRARLDASLAYTTVLTVLRRLEAKGYVGHAEVGRAHRYRALVTRDAARRSALQDLSAKLFNGSTALLLAHAAADQTLSDDDMRRLQELLGHRPDGVVS